jgi:predicted DNA-binding transcriptional regulator AlpA
MEPTQEVAAPEPRAEIVRTKGIALTAAQAAALFNISRRHFDSLVAAGLMPEPYYAGPMSSRWRLSELKNAFRKLPRRTRK